MKRLIHTNRVPYGGTFVLNSPQTGMKGVGTTFESLELSVRAYRRANGIPIGLGFMDELTAAVCEAYPVECKETDARIPQKPHRLRLGDVINGTRVMASFIAVTIAEGKKPIVSADEANQRADICLKCKFNVDFAKPCGGHCGELRALVKSLVGSQEVDHAKELNSCFICHCFLESAVWMRLDIQLKPLSDSVKAQFESVPNCWKKESLLP